jgi:hypothetical protein
MTMFTRHLSLLTLKCFSAALVLCVSSCGDEVPTEPEPGACLGDVSLEVSDGTTPTFSWSPPHPVYEVGVYKMSGSDFVWGLNIDGSAADAVELGIVPPIEYGVVPAGAYAPVSPSALMAGTLYRVYVACATEWYTVKEVGSATFTP